MTIGDGVLLQMVRCVILDTMLRIRPWGTTNNINQQIYLLSTYIFRLKRKSFIYRSSYRRSYLKINNILGYYLRSMSYHYKYTLSNSRYIRIPFRETLDVHRMRNYFQSPLKIFNLKLNLTVSLPSFFLTPNTFFAFALSNLHTPLFSDCSSSRLFFINNSIFRLQITKYRAILFHWTIVVSLL